MTADRIWARAIKALGKRFEDDPRSVAQPLIPSRLPTRPYPLDTRIGSGAAQCVGAR